MRTLPSGCISAAFPKRKLTHRVDHWLNRLGIAHLRDRRADKLSGGEAQRVSLARAFVLQPELSAAGRTLQRPRLSHPPRTARGTAQHPGGNRHHHAHDHPQPAGGQRRSAITWRSSSGENCGRSARRRICRTHPPATRWLLFSRASLGLNDLSCDHSAG